MALSHLLAGSGPAASLSPGKSESKTSGQGDVEFARLFKQAGEMNQRTAASADNALGAKEAAPYGALEGDPREQNDLIAPLSGELSPLAQHVAQAIEGTLSGSAESSTSQNEGLTSDSLMAATLSPLAADHGGPLAEIRQRMDMIASAQRGDALANGTLGNSERVMIAIDTQAAGLRHQQLTAQGMQALSQQATPDQSTAQLTGTFADAIAAVSADDGALPTRPGMDSSFSHSLIGTAAPSGNPANASIPTPGPLTPALTAPLASPQWQQGLGQQLVALHQRAGQLVELHLHPAELGPLTISLKVDDQLAQAQFFSANPQVRAAVEQAIPQLREALEESGIQLGEAMVGEHQQRDDGRDHASHGRAMADLTSGAATSGSDDTSMTDRATAVSSLDSNAIDLYA